jgi:vitamin B12 transporter
MHRKPLFTFFLLLNVALSAVFSQQDAPVYDLEPYLVHPVQIANEAPLPTFATPVSLLDFDPRVDLQNRNFAEAQGDISVRGGTFENTGLVIGNLRIFDPQTGHYLAEIPIDPQMLGTPEVLTGYDALTEGFNASVGTISYSWTDISQTRGQASVALGENNLNTQSLYQSISHRGQRSTHGFDVGMARSSSDGAIEFGDHDMKRISARYQLKNDSLNWIIAGGYQDKFFGWPNLYTPFNVEETESIQTLLLLTEATLTPSTQSQIRVGGYYRRNTDDYEFDRDRPGLYNPYEHETEVGAGFAEWTLRTDSSMEISLSVEGIVDSIESTTLTNSFQSRSYGNLDLEISVEDLAENLNAYFHLGYADTNRDPGSLNPGLRLEYLGQTGAEGTSIWYTEVARSTQVPGYTAIGSSTSGLFAGNPNLGIERSVQLEAGHLFRTARFASQVALFWRQDSDLVDWTFSFDRSNARSANAVDMETTGLELRGAYAGEAFTIAASYAWLHKQETYADPEVDASFYALNFPVHRFTLSLDWSLSASINLRADNEIRIQKENPLRRSSEQAFLSMLSLRYSPTSETPWSIHIAVSNLWDSDYEEIPAVPASPRQFVLRAEYQW